MAARLTRLLVALFLSVSAALPSAAAAVVRPPTSQKTAASPVPDRSADAAYARSYFGARYYRAHIGRFTAVDPLMTIEENLVDPQRWNRYAYARNNSLRYTDPSGEIIETLWDIANVVMGAKSAYENFKAGRYAAAAVDAVGVVLDAGAGAVPGLPGGAGTAIKTARAVERVDDAIDAAKGGTYILRDVDGVVMRTGRSNNLERRMADHARDAKTKNLDAAKRLEDK
jgi:RHS repeat-associated protein